MYRRITRDSIELDYQHLEEIASAYPDLSIDSAKFKDNGLIYDIVTINEEWMFRFPKYDWSIEDMFQEAACLNLTAAHSSMPVPSWEIHENSFVRYKKIAGIAMTPHEYQKIEKTDKKTIVKKLALFLRDLHHIPKTDWKELNIPQSITLHRYDDWLKLYDDVQQDLYPVMTAGSRDSVDALFREIIADYNFADYRESFINGELTDHHIIFDPKKGEVKGIIDFSSAGTGDPATDIACLLLQYGEQFVASLAVYYPAITAMIDRARFIASTYALQWALGGIRTGNHSWFLVHIGKTGQIRPIGSPLPDADL